MKLSKKAQRLLDYLAEYMVEHNGESPTVGEICKDCKTTPMTLLTKTYPELEKFIEMVGDISELSVGDENEM